jgi:hypothetical protein
MNTDGLTREQVLELKPGRELDALVMRTVFKAEKKDIGDECYWVSEVNGEEVCWPRWFSPSTDIAAAFEAEEIAIEKDPAMYVHALASVVFGYNQVQDISDIKKLCLLIHATPEQRCKAALLAVMDGEDEHERD